MPNSFRFRPRYRALALSSIGVGGALVVVALTALGAAVVPLATGAIGALLGGAYLSSPAWKIEVVADDTGLKVRSPNGTTKLELAWSDVVAVTASPSTRTCFVDGGTPAKSLLVPGVGAPAPYDIANKQALYDAILAHVDPAKVKTVDLLEKAR